MTSEQQQSRPGSGASKPQGARPANGGAGGSAAASATQHASAGPSANAGAASPAGAGAGDHPGTSRSCLPAAATDATVLHYLRAHGSKATEATLCAENAAAATRSFQELAGELDPQRRLTAYSQYYNEIELQDEEGALEHSYRALRRFIETSLELYRHELSTMLYPIFVHAFLNLVLKGLPKDAKKFLDAFKDDHDVHASEIQRLAAVSLPEHVRENETARMYRENQYNLKMSEYSLELFLGFLQDQKFMQLLKIVNQHVNISTFPGRPSQDVEQLESAPGMGITGQTTQQLQAFNEQQVALGVMADEPAFTDEVERMLKEQDAKSASTPVGSDGAPEITHLAEDYKKLRKDRQSIPGPTREDIPLPPPKGADLRAEIESIRSLRKVLALGVSTLPSVCCYTFHNTHEAMNCVAISEDATLVAGGFSESVIKLWSMKPGAKLRSLRSDFDPATISSPDDLERIRERPGNAYKRLVGHSGPVYGLSISHDNRYLLSCSEDQTARLWSTDTFSPLVVYKGHNYPVWDIDFGPFGFYFATCSHDRTARVWSCDSITPLRILAGHLADVDTVRFHPNSKYVMTGSSDKTARLWDVQRGACVRVCSYLGSGAVTGVAISPDGKTAACSSEDFSISLWDLGSGRMIKRMTGHTKPIYSLDFSREGAVLASGSADCTVRVWDVKASPSPPSGRLNSQSPERADAARALADAAPGAKIGPGLLAENGGAADAAAEGRKGKGLESNDLLGTMYTKQTPVYKVQFTSRNLLLASGPFSLHL